MESSIRYKEEGNRLFSAKDFPGAIAAYRRGLSSLPPVEHVDEISSSLGTVQDRGQTLEERQRLEVALRSNLSLCLLRLAEKAIPANHHRQQAEQRDRTQVEQFSTEAEKECSAALQLDPDNAKLWYRRGQASLLLATHSSNDALESHVACHNDSLLLRQAESDMKQCEQLLQQQLHKQKSENTPPNVVKGTIAQIVEARNALKRIETARLDITPNCPSSSIQQQTHFLDGKRHATEQLSKISRLETNEHITQSVTIPSDCDSSTTQASSNSMSNGSTSQYRIPTPSQQKERILLLLSRRQSTTDAETRNPIQHHHKQSIFPPQKGEAYFLINMNWWETWCRHVHLFHSYSNCFDSDGQERRDVVQKRVQEVEERNKRVLRLLPPGATLPLYLEKEKKDALGQGQKDNDKMSDSSSSSDKSDDETDIELDLTEVTPGVIDNSSLILNHESLARYLHCCNNETTESDVLLQCNLVRGYHFEILPREAYAALRSWYGEVSPPISRRARNVEDLPWLSQCHPPQSSVSSNTLSVRITLYPERWNAIATHHNYNQHNVINGNSSFTCSACGSPAATSKCTKCRCARYCNRECQRSHWPYHKSHCGMTTKRQHQDEILAARGRVGLNNLGNTCFMSSALQCMSHVTPLTRFFLSDQFLTSINENNINGTGGKVAKAYATLMKDLWMGGSQFSSISPTILKRAIELFAPRFYGVQQQDSAEFLSYLLDALHEDLNRIRNPPYVVLPDVDRGRKLAICGAETWGALCRRNSSYVFENFYGLYKSTCVCPKCDAVSVTFDTFNHITLEIPRISKLNLVVVLVRDHGEQEPTLPMKYCVSIPQNGTVDDVIATLSSMSGVPASRLKLSSVLIDKCSITQLHRDGAPASSLSNEDLLVAYDIASFSDATKINAVITQRSFHQNGTTESRVFGLPLLVSFERNIVCSEVYKKVWKYVKPFVLLGHDDTQSISSFEDHIKQCLRIRVTDPTQNPRTLRTGFDGGSTSILPFASQDKIVDLIGIREKEQIVFFSLEWVDVIALTADYDKQQQIHPSNFLMVSNHTSIIDYEHRVNRLHDSSAVTLDQCFESFTQPERLDDDNMWYCSQCKEHVKAMKTVALWRLPNILVIHLKRFEYTNSLNRSKIGTLVDFPIDGFDMKKHSAYNSSMSSDSQSEELVDDEAPMIYDLFGVTNHYGRMGYGHYTAFTRRWNEAGIEDTWAEFDDENVNEVTGNEIVNPSAYVLFYRRRLTL
ncbi:hypothetical protein HJC23_002790 [Cyclotella cryptica]|uniref:Ubiquitinyl hydrolase 1 n=1 Tax=Cyclotella cryptica TaxID=29204 RepID=A0ABD3PM29_9STRA|eukprot:CCRYP_013053-RA/>CCRYP_013053-RA protein AED:0.25 eAED:0.25 QI:77/1/1/1/1/1/5/485/1238